MNIKKAMNKKIKSIAQTEPVRSKSARSAKSRTASMNNGGITLKEVKDMAKSKGINPGKMKKADIIKTIQRTEGNFDCFGTATAGFCDQHGCCWMTECLSYTNNNKS